MASYDDEIPLPVFDDSVDNMIVVDGLPIAEGKKAAKLEKIIRETFAACGEILSADCPMNNGSSEGYMFIEYADRKAAAAAVALYDGKALDKNHTYKVNILTDFERLKEDLNRYIPPSNEELAAKLPPREGKNLKTHLSDPFGRDQYAIKYGARTAVCWNDPLEPPSPIEERENWTESYARWSPKGTYLVTFHELGVCLWGSSTFDRLRKFEHYGAKVVDFSPNEKYIVTFSNDAKRSADVESLIIWDIATGKKLKGMNPPQKTGMEWPLLKWSACDRFYARLDASQAVTVFDASTFKAIGKGNPSLANITDFHWSPSDPVIAAFSPQPEGSNSPARVVLVEVPSFSELRQKNLFNVVDCKLMWQSAGDYLCCKIDRTTKSGKTTFVNYEIFRMREKGIPIESLEMHDKVIMSAWEPKGDRLAIIHSANDAAKPDVSVYVVREDSVALVGKLEKKSVNQLHWSPQGSRLVIAGIGSLNGNLEFYNGETLELLATTEHFMCSNIAWDPTGRFLATSVSYWSKQVENGYKIWHWHGSLIHDVPMTAFYQLAWRPRPASLISKKEEKLIKKELFVHTKRYEKIDYIRANALDNAAKEKRLAARREFNAALERMETWKNDVARARTALLATTASKSEDWYEEMRPVEVVLEENIEVLEEETPATA